MPTDKTPSQSPFAVKVRFARKLEEGLGYTWFRRLIRGPLRAFAKARAIRWNAQLAPAESLAAESLPDLIEWLRDESAMAPLDVPDWISMDTFGGHCPIQGEGHVDGFPWYYRSRHESMGLVVGEPGSDVVDEKDPSAIFYLELPFYNRGRDGAGWMDSEEVVGFVVRALSAFREERASGWAPPASPPRHRGH